MNIPNMLSVIRICLVPVFILVYFGDSPNSNIGAAIVYAIASLTDILDGRIARKYNITSNLGRILDPLGDKLMTMAVIVCITIDRVIPFWAVTVFLIKECLEITLKNIKNAWLKSPHIHRYYCVLIKLGIL